MVTTRPMASLVIVLKADNAEAYSNKDGPEASLGDLHIIALHDWHSVLVL
ncbi:MAG: hypothetical protein V4525_07755 [Pseudomonadota bacterium]